MFRGELLMAFAKRQRLRALDEAARPFGIFIEIHGLSLFGAASRPVATLNGPLHEGLNVGAPTRRRKGLASAEAYNIRSQEGFACLKNS